jgi:hypothetical protein
MLVFSVLFNDSNFPLISLHCGFRVLAAASSSCSVTATLLYLCCISLSSFSMSVPTIFISIFFIVAYLGGSWSKNVGCTVCSLFCVLFLMIFQCSHDIELGFAFFTISLLIYHLLRFEDKFWLVMLCHVASLWFIPYILASLINHLYHKFLSHKCLCIMLFLQWKIK